MAAKPLSEYPRPPQDNGRGVHWSASLYHPTGADLQFWINELKAMQIKWVKALDDGGGSSIELCTTLLANGIMPVVRIYRERPNPGHIGGREKDAIQRLIAAGVRYFETNNEPYLPAEWANNHIPDNWLDIVVDNFIYDADFILNVGGLPAFSVPGSEGIAKVVARGRKDIFEKGAWLAIHNYTLNHPLDYPYDPVNQEGQPISQEDYDRLAAWQYSHLSWEEIQEQGIAISHQDYDKFNRWAWDGRTREEVNAVRAAHKNPGATIYDDASCFGSWDLFGQTMHETLGFHVPIISTEGGPVVGWGDDNRYAKMNPTTHADWQMEITHFLQEEAPPWYFTLCTWLLASAPLGDLNPAWDQMSWFTHVWDLQFGLEGQLPIVQMLKDAPAEIRHELRAPVAAAVTGLITGRNEQPLSGITLALKSDDGAIAARAVSDENGRYELIVEPGVYDLFVSWLGVVAHDITLTAADVDVLDVKDIDPPGNYEISGKVTDADGLIMPELEVSIQRNGIVHDRQDTDALGDFTFRPSLAGDYILIVEGAHAFVTVSPDTPIIQQDLTISATTSYRYTLTKKRLLPPEETGNNELFYGVVQNIQGEGMNSVALEMRWINADPGTQFPHTTTGSDPFKPDGYYEFLHSKGVFMVQVVQDDYESDIADELDTANVPGRENQPITYEINFQLLPTGNARESLIQVSIPGGRVGQAALLWKDGLIVNETTLNTARTLIFESLEAGVYDLELAGIGVIRSDILLDGHRQETFSFSLMGAIVGRVAGARSEQRTIKLISETYGFIRHGELTQEGQYRFTNLPAGAYRVELDDDIINDLHSDGQSVLEAPLLQAGMSHAVQHSKISGRVHDATNHPTADAAVSLLLKGDLQATAISDNEGHYAFVDLGPGVYDVAIGGNVSVPDIVLDGENGVTVDLLYAAVAETPTKRLQRYYLLLMKNKALAPTLVRLVASWLQTQPTGTIGLSITEAQFAQTVVLLGDGIPESVVMLLQNAECEIIDMRGDLLALAPVLAASSQ